MFSMVLAEPVSLVNPALPMEPVWRLSVEQYHTLIQAGTLTEDDQAELVEGWLVPKLQKSPVHRLSTRKLRKALEPATPSGWYVDSQEPITTMDSEPEPDGVVIQGEAGEYVQRHPGPENIPHVAEVSDTTLHRDRTSKKRIYARAGIPVFWIVNLVDRIVEVNTDSTGPVENPDYRKRQDFAADREAPFVLDGKELARIKVLDLLP